jgi:hypothetical protein
MYDIGTDVIRDPVNHAAGPVGADRGNTAHPSGAAGDRRNCGSLRYVCHTASGRINYGHRVSETRQLLGKDARVALDAARAPEQPGQQNLHGSAEEATVIFRPMTLPGVA